MAGVLGHLYGNASGIKIPTTGLDLVCWAQTSTPYLNSLLVTAKLKADLVWTQDVG